MLHKNWTVNKLQIFTPIGKHTIMYAMPQCVDTDLYVSNVHSVF